jgi:hypothetical protein
MSPLPPWDRGPGPGIALAGNDVEPAWTLLRFESLPALRREPSAVHTAIRIANDLSVGESARRFHAIP